MTDIIMIAVVLLFFGLCFGLIGFFDLLSRSER